MSDEIIVPTDWLSAYTLWWPNAVRSQRDTINDAFRSGWYAALQAVASMDARKAP